MSKSKINLSVIIIEPKIEGNIGKYIGSFGGSGMFKGEKFDAEQLNIKMVHYAISNKFVGKCSVRDGCGVNQT